jgi:prepilin-type processing-associated H-X9-DG protein
LDASAENPRTILSGDDNFEINGVAVKSGLLEFSSNTPIAWSAARHKFSGNILLADGSFQTATISGLTNLVQQTGLATNRLAIP